MNRSFVITAVLAGLVFACTLALRVDGITTHFWLLRDQMRDWSIALRPFSDLPLVGPATHVGGYTIGPAFYWILWAIRVSVGPWFENLPHAGGIGQAMLQSAADTMLLLALWRRTRSVWIALTTVVLVATAAYDLCLSSLVWNPTMGSALAKMATALVLLDWHRGSTVRVAITAALAWSAVHAYTGAIFVAVGVFAALLADPIARRDWHAARRNASVVVVVVALLQLPYVAYQIVNRFTDSAMGAVSGGLWRVLSGSAQPELVKSVTGFTRAFLFIEVSPWHVPMVGWVLLACGGIVAIRHRRDVSLLAVTLLPQVAAILGYALFLDDLDNYYYLSLMPAAVFTVVLAATAVPSPRFARAIAVVLLVAALAAVPGKMRFAATMHRMPEYGVLVDGAQRIKKRQQPMRAVRTDFRLPPTSDAQYLYELLGGRIDRSSPWVGVISADGSVTYRNVDGSER